jgi:NADH-quinone oxidoreductase subunit J
MTTRPRLKIGPHLLPGLAAAALFVVVVGVTLGAEFPDPQGFPEGANITASIGYAMFDVSIDRISGQTLVGAESFLVAFIVVAILLDAALDGAVLLARREDGSVREVIADGGREIRRAVGAATGDERDGDTARSGSREPSTTDAGSTGDGSAGDGPRTDPEGGDA